MPTCAGCGQDSPAADRHGDPNFIKAGWAIPINMLGYYNGFDDSNDDETVWAVICHGCVLRMLEALPGLKKLTPLVDGGGLHPADHTAPPCCEYAWSFERSGDVVRHFRVSNGAWTAVEI